MLNFPIGVASLLVTGVESWLSNTVGDGTLRAASAPLMPQNPSTLRLALIAVGTLVVYYVVKQARSTRIMTLPTAGRSGGQSAGNRPRVEKDDRPKRGAA